MELGITIPLQKFLHLRQPPYGTCADPLFCWDVHRVKIASGRVLLVASNASNRFIAVTRMTVATWKTWGRETLGAIADALAISGFTEEAIASYFAAAGLPEGPCATPPADGALLVTKTHGRSSVGCMNRAIDDIWFADVDTQLSIQADMCYRLNNQIICHVPTRKDYAYPAEAFAEDLRERGIAGERRA